MAKTPAKRKLDDDADDVVGVPANTARLTAIVTDPSLRSRVVAFGDDMVDATVTVHTRMTEAATTVLTSYYDIGDVVLPVAKAHGKSGAKVLCEATGLSLNILYAAMKMARTYDRDAIEVLSAKRGKNGFAATWTHMNTLAGVENEVVREKLCDQMFANGWTVDELQAHLPTNESGRGLTATGRPPSLPASAIACVAGLTARFTASTNYVNGLLVEADDGLTALQKRFEAIDSVDSSVIESLEAAMTAIRRNSDSNNKAAMVIGDLLDEAKGAAKGKAKAALPAPQAASPAVKAAIAAKPAKAAPATKQAPAAKPAVKAAPAAKPADKPAKPAAKPVAKPAAAAAAAAAVKSAKKRALD